MAYYTDEQLAQLLRDLEADWAERKESLEGDVPASVREAICAFANDLPNHRKAGVVFIGAKNDGTPAGLPITDELLLQLADMKTDGNIVPPPTLSVEKRVLLGVEYAVASVLPSDSPPVRYKGRVCVRTGPRRGHATAQDERILNEKRRHGDRPFDARPVTGASLRELDLRFFETTYLNSAFAADVLAANQRSIEQRLAATKMTVSADEPTPTALGLLVLGLRTRDFLPGAYLQFLRIAGTTLADPILDESAVDGMLDQVLRRIDDKLIAHNRSGVDFVSGTTELRQPDYPLAALQQLIRNAVLHRTYEATHAPVRVTWFDDRIEINNPGGPFGMVTAENFGEPGVTDYRNPNLAEALRVLNFVQRFGAGIPTARRVLAENGNPPPEFSVQPSYVGIVVRRAP